MNYPSKIALGISAAMALASVMAVHTADAAKREIPSHREYREQVDARLPAAASTKQQAVTFFLADPELGVAGVYRANGKEVFFEARRAEDALTGAPGELSMRFVDAEGRTLALGGEPIEKRWVPKTGEFTPADAGADAQLLSGLGKALQSANLHAALAAEKSALADLALQTAGTPATRLPVVRKAGTLRTSAAADAGQMALFYERIARGVKMQRDRAGVLRANLGNGITLQTAQFVKEPTRLGESRRVEAYSMVTNRDGVMLSAEFGGDEIPRDWDKALQRVNGRGHASLATDFGRAATALQALAYSGRPAKGISLSQQGEHDAMQRLARTMAGGLMPERVAEPQPALAASNVTKASGGTLQTHIQVWRQPLTEDSEHSATRVAKYRYQSATSGVRYNEGWVYYCNHGACATQSTMSRKCDFIGPRLTYYRLPARFTTAGGHTCNTPYSLFSVKGRHNCHDDSSVQVRAVRGQSYGLTSGRCSDGYFHAWAPTCGAQ